MPGCPESRVDVQLKGPKTCMGVYPSLAEKNCRAPPHLLYLAYERDTKRQSGSRESLNAGHAGTPVASGSGIASDFSDRRRCRHAASEKVIPVVALPAAATERVSDAGPKEPSPSVWVFLPFPCSVQRTSG